MTHWIYAPQVIERHINPEESLGRVNEEHVYDAIEVIPVSQHVVVHFQSSGVRGLYVYNGILCHFLNQILWRVKMHRLAIDQSIHLTFSPVAHPFPSPSPSLGLCVKIIKIMLWNLLALVSYLQTSWVSWRSNQGADVSLSYRQPFSGHSCIYGLSWSNHSLSVSSFTSPGNHLTTPL